MPLQKTYLCWANPKASSNRDLQSWQTKSPILLSIFANFSFASSVTSTTLYSGSISPRNRDNATYKYPHYQAIILRLNWIYHHSFLMQKLNIPVWYIGISSPSASSRINVPETGEVLSSSNVSLRDTLFRAEIWIIFCIENWIIS